MTFLVDQEYVQGQDNDDAGTGVGKLRIAANNNTILGQSFTPGSTSSLNKIRLYLKKVGSPTGNIYVEIRSDGADPTVATLQGTSNNFDVSTLNTTYDWYDLTFASPVAVTGSTEYWILLHGDYSASSSNAAVWGVDTTSPTYSGGHYGRYGNGSAAWEDITSYDALFEEFNSNGFGFNPNDKTSNGNNLETNRGVTVNSSVPGSLTGATTSIEFGNGEVDEVWMDDNASISLSGNMTIEFWAYIGSGAGDIGIIKDSIAQNQRSYGLYIDGSENFTFIVSDDGANITFKNQTSGVTEDAWNHIAAAYTASAGKIQFFLNGSQVGIDQTGLDTSVFNGTARLNVFSSRTTGRFCDIRLWNTVRTQAEISANMNTFLVGNESGLILNWQLQPASGTINNNVMTGFM